MPRNYRVAIIGRTGRGNYGHGLDVVWRNFDNVQVVAVADDNPQGLAEARQRTGAQNAYADYREMLRRERPDIVAIASRWLDAHHEMVLACAEHGASMFMEKPICPTLREADEMIEVCERHHVRLALAHQTHYSPRVEQIQRIIAAGRIGDVLELRGRGKEDRRVGGEDMMVLGSHIMDLMRMFAGEPRWCFATVNVIDQNGMHPVTRADVRQGAEGIGPLAGNHITAQYGFDNGIMGYFGSQYSPRNAGNASRFGLEIRGSRGMIQLTTGSLPPASFLPDPTWFPGRSNAAWQPITSQGLGQPETLNDGGLGLGNIWVVRDLMEAIENDREPKCNLYEGRGALEMILAVYESHRLGRPVEMPLQNRQHPLTLI
jgi:predicted dehydrogenase